MLVKKNDRVKQNGCETWICKVKKQSEQSISLN